jgi:hypothetical protein
LRSASRADRVAMASRSGSASLNIKAARVGSSTSGRLSWSGVSDVPGRQVGAEIGDRCGGEWRRRRTVAFHRSVPGVWPPASQWRGTRPGPLPDVHAATRCRRGVRRVRAPRVSRRAHLPACAAAAFRSCFSPWCNVEMIVAALFTEPT